MIPDFLNSNFGTGIIGVLGTLLGGVLGLFGERHMRHRGEILFKSSEWDLTCALRTVADPSWPDPPKEYIPFDRSLLNDATLMGKAMYVAYSCDIKMFNEKEVDTGLRDVAVVFVDVAGAELLRSVPQTAGSRNLVSIDPEVINLPARLWHYGQYSGQIQPGEFAVLARSTKAEFRAFLPGDKPFVRVIHEPLWE